MNEFINTYVSPEQLFSNVQGVWDINYSIL